MAANLKPDGIGKEGQIKFGEYRLLYSEFGRPEKLIDGNINNITAELYSAVFLNPFYGDTWFVFTLPQKSNIWAIGLQFTDRGGTTNQPINLYKLSIDGVYEHIGVYPTNPQFNVWYKLFSDMEAGTYKITPTGRYSSFNEWYVERANKNNYLYIKNNAVYGMREVE